MVYVKLISTQKKQIIWEKGLQIKSRSLNWKKPDKTTKFIPHVQLENVHKFVHQILPTYFPPFF